jgi:hypothetical protein
LVFRRGNDRAARHGRTENRDLFCPHTKIFGEAGVNGGTCISAARSG